MSEMNESRVEELLKLEEKATPGPWVEEGWGIAGMVRGGRPNGEIILRHDPNRLMPKSEIEANQNFIAPLRNDFARVVAYYRAKVKELEGERDELKSAKEQPLPTNALDGNIPTNEQVQYAIINFLAKVPSGIPVGIAVNAAVTRKSDGTFDHNCRCDAFALFAHGNICAVGEGSPAVAACRLLNIIAESAIGNAAVVEEYGKVEAVKEFVSAALARSGEGE